MSDTEASIQVESTETSPVLRSLEIQVTEDRVRQSIALKADVVFKDTHYHSALSRALFTNTDWSLIRTCPVPLWLVSPRKIFQHQNIIAAIDPFHEHDKPAAMDDQILSIGIG